MKRKRLKEIHQQQELLMNQMKELPADSDTYRRLHEEYARFLEEEENLLKSGKWFDRILQILGIGVSIGATFVMPAWLACKASDDDKNMKMVNGRIWNLIPKRNSK